jgi:uncharacterized protein
MAAVGIGVLGAMLYDATPNNWCIDVGTTMLRDARVRQLPTTELFLSLAIPAALFSPLGEELFFRGVLHESIAVHTSHKAAAVITGIVFGLMHLFHHGVTAGPNGIEFRLCPG